MVVMETSHTYFHEPDHLSCEHYDYKEANERPFMSLKWDELFWLLYS